MSRHYLNLIRVLDDIILRRRCGDDDGSDEGEDDEFHGAEDGAVIVDRYYGKV